MQEIILEFLFGPEGIQKMPLPVMAIAGAAQALGGIISGFGARKQARTAAKAQRQYENRVASLEANRQAVIDPFSGVTDLSSMLSNPFANLQVATQAAEMQATETDISLASTLDALRATGAGAGGATALAQAAARSKQGIAADIERQEASNAQARAAGEAALQQAMMSEGVRVQEAQARGKEFVFNAQEQREMQQLDRAQALANQYSQQAAMAKTAQSQAFGSAIGGLGAFGAGGGFGKQGLNLFKG